VNGSSVIRLRRTRSKSERLRHAFGQFVDQNAALIAPSRGIRMFVEFDPQVRSIRIKADFSAQPVVVAEESNTRI